MTEKQKLWVARIDEWKRSGLSQRQYCEDNDLSRGTFQWWRRRVKEQTDNSFVEISVDRAVGIESKRSSELHIAIGRYTITVCGEVDPDQLRSVLAVLDGR